MKEAEKQSTYMPRALACGAKLVTVAMTCVGGMSAATVEFVQSVANDIKTRTSADEERPIVPVHTQILQSLSKGIAIGNGACLILSGKLRHFGIDFGMKPPFISAPAVRAPSGDDNVAPEVARPAAAGTDSDSESSCSDSDFDGEELLWSEADSVIGSVSDADDAFGDDFADDETVWAGSDGACANGGDEGAVASGTTISE